MRSRFYMERRKDPDGKLCLADRPVFMSVSFRGERLMLGTGLKGDLKHWDQEEQRFRISYSEALSANLWLDTLDETARMAWDQLSNMTHSPGKQEFLNTFSALKPRKSAGFMNVYLNFLEEGSERWSSLTYRKVRTIYRHLREYEDEKDIKLGFRDMDKGFVEGFFEFYRRKGNSENTAYKAVSIIIWFLNWASEKEYHNSREYRNFYRYMEKRDTSREEYPFLSFQEVKSFATHPCGTKKKERVRDLFCLMCYTGIRFAELDRLTKGDISSSEILIRKPGGKTRKVPLNNRASELLDAYKDRYFVNNRAFPRMSIITFNKYLRILAAEAGFGKEARESLAAGWAVSTFIANALEMEVHPDLIPGFTGVRRDSRIARIRNELLRRESEKLNGDPDNG